MPSIFASLNTAYTGLQAHQVMVDTTGHNIANANSSFYTRQVVNVSSSSPINFGRYSYGQGVSVDNIMRLHDEYTFGRYRKSAHEQQNSQTQYEILREVSTYFPEVDEDGIFNDLQQYFNAWESLSTKSSDPAQKIVLAQRAQTLAHSIRETRDRLTKMQNDINEEIKTVVTEVNRLGKEIANLNKQIIALENEGKRNQANDLRDQRDQREMAMAKLVGGEAFKSNLQMSGFNPESVDFSEDYNYKVGDGYTIVDGSTFHPLVLDNSDGFYRIMYQQQDFKPKDITGNMRGGKLGALYATGASDKLCDCQMVPGNIQHYINQLDTFAAGIIEATNNIYSQSSSQALRGDFTEHLSATEPVIDSPHYSFRTGSFDVVLYDSDGNEMARKTVQIHEKTTMNDIITQLNKNSDDNGDNNANNDFDDFFEAVYNERTRTFQVNPKFPSKDISVSLQDNGTNIAGALGINRFFEGRDALSIDLNIDFRNDPTLIQPYREKVTGNYEVANMMIQLQYDAIIFREKDGSDGSFKIAEYFKNLATRVGSDASDAKVNNEAKLAVLTSVKKEYSAISEVSLDEELTNLIRFQSGYTANAKVVSTVDEIINTLLGIKQ
ncbi:flagellar hook-associated protein FlgK [Helicobacter monodelphidis]|uniref:flagellar hook-associated protein FlgK n=1 Tax=Helicobacter sp. 15-1451 TaxID=2004995 RepID=UPI000DCF3E2D|nr:flagellar hook-associated protein FlgK [Helicobacter sp. 15-1451]RAX58032.1 flagellar hook-associated protein FlgK [Helicobacter sp. 15-1451]